MFFSLSLCYAITVVGPDDRRSLFNTKGKGQPKSVVRSGVSISLETGAIEER